MTHGAVDLSALGGVAEPAKAATTEAPEDHSPEDVKAVTQALTEAYDKALSKRQATMAVLPMKALARAAISALSAFPMVPDYEPETAPDQRFYDRHRATFDPEEYHVPNGELSPDLLPETNHAGVRVVDGGVELAVYEAEQGFTVGVTMDPEEAERFHLAGLAAVHAARAARHAS